MTQINIKKYQDSDFKEVISLLVSSFESKFCHRQKFTTNDIENIMYSVWDITAEDPSYIHFVAKKDGKVVGAILIQIGKKIKRHKKIHFFKLCYRYGFFSMLLLIFKLSSLERYTIDDCYVEHIVVDEAMRGKGVGELLIDYAEEVLRGMGFSSLSLVVAENNPAKHLYDRKGFNDIEHISSGFKKYFIGIKKWIFMKKAITGGQK